MSSSTVSYRWLMPAVAIALVAGTCAGDEIGTTSSDVSAPATLEIPSSNGTSDRVFVGADGVATTVEDTSRIVSLTGDISEIIFELGLGKQIVAVDITTTYPPYAERLKRDGGNVGFGQALTAEAVLKHDPSLVLGDETIEPVETIEQLRAAGVPVVILKYQTTLTGVGTKIHEVARILGVGEAGQRLADRVTDEIATAQDRAEAESAEPRVAYLYTRGPSLIFLFGRGIPTNAMIQGAGAIDGGAEIGEGAIPLTPEALVAAAPDVIIVPESGIEALGGFDALLEIPGVSETPAGRSAAFLAYDEAYFFNLGPRAGAALNDFVADLYEIIER